MATLQSAAPFSLQCGAARSLAAFVDCNQHKNKHTTKPATGLQQPTKHQAKQQRNQPASRPANQPPNKSPTNKLELPTQTNQPSKQTYTETFPTRQTPDNNA